MPITLPSYVLTDKEEIGLLHAQGKFNQDQLAKEPPGTTKTPIQYWAFVARTIANSWHAQKIAEDAAAAAKTVTDANPTDVVT